MGSTKMVPKDIIKEEGSREINNSTEYNIQNYVDEPGAEGDEDTQDDNESQHNDEILANLHIMKDHMQDNQDYQVRQQVVERDEGKTFFTSLPQTQDELDQLSIDSADYQIKHFIQDLFERNVSKKVVQ